MPVLSGDELGEMLRVRRGNDDINWRRSKGESLGGEDNIDIEIFYVCGRPPLLPCPCPKICGQLKRFVRERQVATGCCRSESVEPSNAEGLVPVQLEMEKAFPR